MAKKDPMVFSDVKGNLKNIENLHRNYYKDVDRSSTGYESGPNYRSKDTEEFILNTPNQEAKEIGARVKGNLLANEDAKKYAPDLNAGNQPVKGGYKKGGFVHAKDAMAKHSGGFKHHMDGMKQHAAGFKPHHEHVKTMCGGGMSKGKK